MLHFVILCGGSGSRLWPKSREKLPKQLLALTDAHHTMLQNTLFRIQKVFQRLDSETETREITILCNQEHGHIVELQVKELANVFDTCVPINVVCEPKGRDSAPAICIAALLKDLSAYTFILPCDHVFNDEEFANCCAESLPYLEQDNIMTFGIKPTHAETGYGYIQTNAEKDTIQFVEKPDMERAEQFFKSGTYLWNAGIFAFRNSAMVECFEKYATDILDNCLETMSKTDFTPLALGQRVVTLSAQPFVNCRAISVDYAIMENLCKDPESRIGRKTLLYSEYWNDIGSFSALYDQYLRSLLEISSNISDTEIKTQNITKGDIFILDSKNCYIESEKAFVAVVGMENTVIVNTPDALLICNKDRSQDVKKVTEYLKQAKREEAICHTKVFRPWGWYLNVEGNDYSGFKVKRIAVYPGKRLSLQSHDKRSEHWVMVRGNAKVQVGHEFIFLEKDQHVYIPIQTLHRIENIGSELLEFTETQIGEYLGEDDIIRYEDDFGRV